MSQDLQTDQLTDHMPIPIYPLIHFLYVGYQTQIKMSRKRLEPTFIAGHPTAALQKTIKKNELFQLLILEINSFECK